LKKLVIISLIIALTILAGCSNSNNSKQGASQDNSSATKTSKKPKVLKFGLVTPREHTLSVGALKFKEIVERESGGSLEVQVFTDGQLGGDRDMLEGLQLGTLQATNASTGPIASFVKAFNVFDLPFLFKDNETAYRVLDGPSGQELLDMLPAAQMVGLGYWENGFRNLTNSKHEVKSVKEVKGLKIRTIETPLHMDTWNQIGASATPMAVTELFTALQQGVVDGQENPYSNIKLNKFYEAQKYLTNTRHIYSASVMLISKKYWDSLSDDEKLILQRASNEVRDYQRELSQKENELALQFLKDSGMIVTDLSPEAHAEFVEALNPIYDKYKSEIGEELVNRVLEAIK
jgi:tripartite ATP-independent transporter DctP family solute receptor